MKTNNKVFFAVDVMMKSKGRVSQITIVKQTEEGPYCGTCAHTCTSRKRLDYIETAPAGGAESNKLWYPPYVDPTFSDVRRATKYFQSNGTIPR